MKNQSLFYSSPVSGFCVSTLLFYLGLPSMLGWVLMISSPIANAETIYNKTNKSISETNESVIDRLPRREGRVGPLDSSTRVPIKPSTPKIPSIPLDLNTSNCPANPGVIDCSVPWIVNLIDPFTLKYGNNNFQDSCVTHDLCYSYANRTYNWSRERCDNEFCDGMTHKCGDDPICMIHAELFCAAVKQYGSTHFKTSNSIFCPYEPKRPVICRSDADCTSSQYCQAPSYKGSTLKHCVKRCSDVSDCQGGHSCSKEGKCFRARCDNPAECVRYRASLCISNLCYSEDIRCVSNKQCGDDAICWKGFCKAY